MNFVMVRIRRGFLTMNLSSVRILRRLGVMSYFATTNAGRTRPTVC